MSIVIPKTKMKSMINYNQILENPYKMSLEEYYKTKQKIQYPNKLENFKFHQVPIKDDVKVKMTKLYYTFGKDR